MKKMKEKYKDQDDEDRELIMQLLGVRMCTGHLFLFKLESLRSLMQRVILLLCSLQGPTRRTRGRRERKGKKRRKPQRSSRRRVKGATSLERNNLEGPRRSL